jgi:hypothetical protein
MGWIATLIYPHRFFPHIPVTGLSLLASPLATASAMHLIGRVRFGSAQPRTGLYSFWHAFDFAFGVALARFLLLS